MPGFNNVTCGNDYTTAATASDVWNSRGGWFSVAGQAAYVELQYGKLGFGYWTSEQLLGDGAFAFVPANCTGVRFRNATAGLNATVTAYIAQGDEPPLSIISAGSVSVTSSINFQHNDTFVAAEPTIDLEDSATLTWALTDDPANTRVKITPTVIGAPPTGNAGGDLSGSTYPNPVVAAGKITTAKLATAVTLDAIATANATAADVTMNSHKITNLTNGSGAQDATAFGQLASLADKSSASVQTFTGQVAAPSFLPASGIFAVVSLPTTITPDYATRQYNRAGIVSGQTGTLTIAAPTNPPGASQSGTLTITVVRGAAGTPALAWNAAYQFAGLSSIVPAASKSAMWTFIYDVNVPLWICSSRTADF